MAQNIKNKKQVLNGINSQVCGHVSELMERFVFERINSQEARKVIYQEAEDAFKNQLDDESGVYGIWQGEFWGKWMIGAAQFCEYHMDEELREFIHKAALKLITYQMPNGYLGTYRDPQMIFPADRAKTKTILGWPCNWNWNIWCRKYTLWGLLEAWRVTDDSKILQAATHLADHLIKQLHDNHIRLADTGTFAGLPSCSILKPMILLYEATQNNSYLKFAQEIAEDWMRKDGSCPNLIVNALKGIPVHEWYSNTPRWTKVYEMLSCFEGILALYKVTEDKKLLKASMKFHILLKQNELNVLFSVGFNDIFSHATAQLNAISEPCDIIHWMRFCYELFTITGIKSYMDDFELAFFNPFLAGVYKDGKWGSRGVRSHGHHFTAPQQAMLTRNHCCVNNIPRGFINMTQAIVMVSNDTVYVNLYAESKCDFRINAGRISLDITGDYLASGLVKLSFNATLSHSVKLKLRIPGWATANSLTINEKHFDDNKTDWFEIMLNSGRTEMSLHFDRKLNIREHIPFNGNSEWYKKRWMSNDDKMKDMWLTGRASTLVYGPLLLARSKYIGNSEKEMFGKPLPVGFSCTLKAVESKKVWYAFEAEISSENKCFQTIVCDYHSAGNEKLLDEPRFFSIYF